MVGDDLVIVSFHTSFNFGKGVQNTNIHQPSRNHKPPHQNPSKRPIDMLKLALQLLDRYDYAACICHTYVEGLSDVRRLQRCHLPLRLALLP
jgi:hypothetical protein